MSAIPLKILLVDDSPGDALLLRELLTESSSSRFELVHVEALGDALSAVVEHEFRLVLLALGLGEDDELETVHRFRARVPELPVIVLTGNDDNAWAVRSLHEGAQDYLVKGTFDGPLLLRSMRYAIERHAAYAELQFEANEREILAEIGRIITSSLEIGDVYQRFAERLGKLLDFDRLTIDTINVDEGTFANAYATGLNVPERSTGVPIDLRGSMTEMVLRRRSVVVIQGESAQDAAYQYPSLAPGIRAGIRSFLSVPLIYKDKVISVLHLRSARVNAYSDRDSKLAERVAHQIAGAVANSQLHADLEREAKEREVLAEIGRIITSSLNIEEVYERFAQEVRKLLPFDRIGVVLIDAEGGEFTTAYVSGVEVSQRMPGDVASLEGSVTEQVVRTRSGLLVQGEDAEELGDRSPGLLPLLQDELRSFLSVPLISHDEVIGALHLRSASPKAYTERDLAIAQSVANQIAGAIPNSQLHAAVEREGLERAALAEIGRIISSSLDVDEVYERFAEQVREMIPFDRIVIGVVNLDQWTLTYGYILGAQESLSRPGETISMSGRHSEEVVRSKAGVLIQTQDREELADRLPSLLPLFDEGVRAFLTVPLNANDQVVGVLMLRSNTPSAYTQRHLQLAESIGHQIAGAIANSQLHQRTMKADQALAESNRRLEEALADLGRTQEELIRQERLRALGQMASGIAHDFNNALTPILGFSELLLERRETLDDQDLEKHYLLNINLAAADAAAVVRRLREFYRTQEEGPELSPVLLDDVILQALSLTQAKWKDEAQAKGATIRVETEFGRVPALNGNESELREALTNLIFNAVDAMPEGGTITIRSRLDGPNAVLEVSDTGSGMSEEVKRSCLDPFFTTKGPQGTGMGLPMVYGIVRRHRGTLDIESEVGRGTTFVITLPIDAHVPQRDNPSDATSRDAESLRILLVDDEPMVLELLSNYLVTAGHRVHTASNGREGAEKFREGTFDLVVTDKAMPEMGGDEMASVISKEAQGQPIIMLTGFRDVLAVTDERPDGVSRVLSKPIKQAELRRAVQEAVAGGHSFVNLDRGQPSSTQRPVGGKIN